MTRPSWLQFSIGALFLVAALSQARVQLFQRGQIIDLARKTNRFMLTHTDYAKRGKIFSADGKPLAFDEQAFELGVIFKKIPQADAFYMDLSHATGIPATEFAQLANSGVSSRFWQRPMSAAQAAEIQNVKSNWRADGISLQRTGHRNYPLGDAAAGVIGLIRDDVAALGLEKSQNKRLAGQDGKTIGFTDKNGSFLPMRLDPKSEQREDGETIVLTLDSELQESASLALREAVDSNKADSGVAIVMDPATGDILAMANWPSFDPNNVSKKTLSRTSDFNPAYMAELEPGSTFKILTLAKALDDGKASMSESYNCVGQYSVRPFWKPVKCDAHHGTRAHGVINAQEAIAKSCNVCAAKWAVKVGRDPFLSYVEKLGLLNKPALGVPFEQDGHFNYQEYAKELQLATLGFGQSINVTPITLANAFCMLGNDGFLMHPRLIRQVGDHVNAPKKIGQVIRPETAHEVMQCMEAVIETDEGTGKAQRIPGYRLAGKTGTAQRMRGKDTGGYVSNFVGFVPSQKPRAMILVMIDNPKAGAYYGASVAGPVFLKLAQDVIRRYGITPTAR